IVVACNGEMQNEETPEEYDPDELRGKKDTTPWCYPLQHVVRGEHFTPFGGALNYPQESCTRTYATSSIKYMPLGTTCRKGNSEICERVSSSIASPCARRWSTISVILRVFQYQMALDT